MSPPAFNRGTAVYLAGAAALLAAVVFWFHGGAMHTGLFLDDYAHYTQLQEADWTLRDLVDACRLEIVGGAVKMWWLPETTLRFFRPVSFGLMKATYTLSDWSPYWQHVASITWHLLACVLMVALLLRLGVRKRYALPVVIAFALHPGHIATVQWIACQSELMVTTFLVAATWCYAEYRHWSRDRTAQPTGHWGWLVAASVFFVLGLGCRENAIMFPALAFIGDRAAGRPLKLREWGPYILLGVIALGYLALRQSYLGGVALPPKPYIIPPGDPDFFRFIFDKMLYYLMGQLVFVPIVPIGGIPFLREYPLLFYGGSAVVVVLLVWLVWLRRRDEIGLLGPAWMVLFFLPVLPAFASPHHLYLPGVGWAMIFASILTAVHGEGTPMTRWRPRAAMVMCLGLVALFAPLTDLLSDYAIGPAQEVENQVYTEIANAKVPVQPGDTVYFGNFPLIAHYAETIIASELGIPDVTVHPLVWSTRLLGVTSPTEIELLDDRTVEIAIAGDRYFADPLGRLVREAQGKSLHELLAQPYESEDFTIELREADEDGLRRLRFHFHEPLTRPGVHLFWGSERLWAYQILPKEPRDDQR